MFGLSSVNVVFGFGLVWVLHRWKWKDVGHLLWIDCNSKYQLIEWLRERMKEPNISIYFFFLPITQWCSISDVLFTGEGGVSDFSVLKCY